MNRSAATEASANPPRRAAVVVPFPSAAARRRPARTAPERAGEARGEILLFLGVRYERLAS